MLRQEPWFDRRALEVGDNVDHCACDGRLPDNTRLEWSNWCCWLQQSVCYFSDLFLHRGRSRGKARREFTLLVCNVIMRMRSSVSTTGCDMYFYRTMGTMDYLDTLNAVTGDRIESWLGMYIFCRTEWVWSKAQVFVDSVTFASKGCSGMGAKKCVAGDRDGVTLYQGMRCMFALYATCFLRMRSRC